MAQAIRFLCLAGLVLLCTSVAMADFASPAKNVSNSAESSMYPKIAGTDGSPNLFLVWMEYVNAGLQRLCFAKSTDQGQIWTTPVNLMSTGQVYTDAFQEQAYSICVEGTSVHVVYNWRADNLDDWEIYYLRSDNSGNSWSSAVQISDNASNSLYPDVAARGSYVHVTYQDDWPGNYEIMYKRITDSGAGTIDQTRRLTFSGSDSRFPKIAVSSSGSSVNIVYEDVSFGGVINLFYKHLYDSGAGAYNTSQLTFGTADNTFPDITTSGSADSQYIYIVYCALWPGNLDIMYKRLDNWGEAGYTTYTARLTYATTDSYNPVVDFDTSTNNVHISYDDDWPGNYDVMYRKLADYGGGSFTGQRVSWGVGMSGFSSLTSAGAWACIAWMDHTPGNFEILFKYGY